MTNTENPASPEVASCRLRGRKVRFSDIAAHHVFACVGKRSRRKLLERCMLPAEGEMPLQAVNRSEHLQQLAQQPSVLDLLMLQQSHQQPGMRCLPQLSAVTAHCFECLLPSHSSQARVQQRAQTGDCFRHNAIPPLCC